MKDPCLPKSSVAKQEWDGLVEQRDVSHSDQTMIDRRGTHQLLLLPP
jgi:hypothetical protein